MIINVKFYIKITVNYNRIKTQIPVNVIDSSNYPDFSGRIISQKKNTHNQGVAGSSPAGPTVDNQPLGVRSDWLVFLLG
jgi:hypothetical protein